MSVKKSKPIVHVMMDIETLSTRSNAAIIQVGFASVHPETGLATVSELSVSPEKYREDSIAQYFHVDQNTIDFHHRVNPRNFQNCLNSDVTLQELAQFVKDSINTATENGKYSIRLWACGTDFDITILSNFWRVISPDSKLPWFYSFTRDYRTLRELYKKEVPLGTINDHSAGRDAVNQLKHLIAILVHIGKWEGTDNGIYTQT